jgi:hypothetical protein
VVDQATKPVNSPISWNDFQSAPLYKCPRDGHLEPKRLPMLSRSQGSLVAAFFVATAMKDFAHASFPPEVISVMEVALDAAVASLPEPVHSSHVQTIAEAILRAAHGGERDPIVLQRLALMELQLTQR